MIARNSPITRHGLRCVEGLDEEVLEGAPRLAQLSGKCHAFTTYIGTRRFSYTCLTPRSGSFLVVRVPRWSAIIRQALKW